MRASLNLATLSKIAAAALRVPNSQHTKSSELHKAMLLAARDAGAMQLKHQTMLRDALRKEDATA